MLSDAPSLDLDNVLGVKTAEVYYTLCNTFSEVIWVVDWLIDSTEILDKRMQILLFSLALIGNA